MLEPLVLIPGMMCDERMWGDLPVSFGKRQIIHALPVDHSTMTELAADILRDAPPAFAMAGLSMGGIVAMEMLAQAPERVTRLALLDTNPRAELPEIKVNRARQIAEVQAGGLASVLRDEMKPNYLADGPNKAAILDLCMDMALALGPDAFVRQSCALRDRADRQETLRAYKGPALVLMGEDDRLCPRDRHELMQALMPQSKFAVIKHAAHLPTLEQPIETAEHIRHWLAE